MTKIRRRRTRKKALPPDTTATVTQLSHDGRGIAHIDGKVIFIAGALPDETVHLRYLNVRAQYAEAQTLTVLTPSTQRITPRCAYFGTCGGCRLQHLDSQTALAHKQQAFLELLQHQSQIQPDTVLPPLQAHPWGYRRKARLSVRHVPGKDTVMVGFRETGGRLVTDMDSCAVLHPSVGELIREWRNLLYTLAARDDIPQLEVAVTDTDTAMIIRHLKPLVPTDLTKLKYFAEQHQFRLYLQPKGPDSISLYYPEQTEPTLHYTLAQYGLTLHFHPSQFIQVNSAMNALMIAQALSLLDLQPNDRVLDLFCGIGNFTLPIAQQCQHVTGVEGSEEAVQQAQLNAQHNTIYNTEFFCADLSEALYNEPWVQQTYHKIVLDPPRSGAQTLVSNIMRWQPQRIVYISCNPATLARDASILVAQGFRMQQAGVMDMFPQTQHVEAIALFTR